MPLSYEGRYPRNDHSPGSNSRIISSRRVNEEDGSQIGRTSGLKYSTNTTEERGRSSDEESFLISRPAGKQLLPDSFLAINQPQLQSVESISEYSPGKSSLTLLELLPYYLPIFSWANEYCIEFLLGDLVGGVSLATFQIPLAISYASSLAKVPISCGLYSLGIAPLIYMILGSVPQMITGPEAPISLIVGQAVEPLLHHAKKNKASATEYVVAITFVSGATLFGFGLGRFGFLDNVLCDSLLKGFICGVGAVMVINSLIPLFGLEDLLDQVANEKNDQEVHSPFDKLRFVMKNHHSAHSLTVRVSVISFLCIMGVRVLKARAAKSQRTWPKYMVYVPEILILVSMTTIFSKKFNWNDQGLQIVGVVADAPSAVSLFNPFSTSHLKLAKMLSSSGFVCAMLGFFESTTALKSLGSSYDLPISSNRELVALGAMNLVCSIFGGLPSFGGYGRSKINAITAKTTFSGAIMGIISLVAAQFVSRLLYYIPKCVLSVITAVIGVLLIGEGPPEVLFHWRSCGYSELITFFTTVFTTIFFSIEAGIAVGLGYLLIRVIKNSAESNIQILGRVPGTNTFLDADLANDCIINEHANSHAEMRSQNFEKRPSQLNLFTDRFRPLNIQALEEIEGCLIIRIPEPLAFTNASDLRSRLKRLEMYGSAKAHPALKRKRDTSMSKYMVFDLEGMSYIDSSAAHILYRSLLLYNKRNIRSFFVRVSKSKTLRKRLTDTGITNLLATDLESMNLDKVVNGDNTFDASRGMSSSGELDGPFERDRISDSQGSISKPSPFLEHIRSALHIIDCYEHQCSSNNQLSA